MENEREDGLGVLGPEIEPETDEPALNEEKIFHQKAYDHRASLEALRRTQGFQDAINRLGISLVRFLHIAVWIVGAITLWNYLAPSRWIWIPESRMEELKSLMTGAIAAATAILARQYYMQSR